MRFVAPEKIFEGVKGELRPVTVVLAGGQVPGARCPVCGAGRWVPGVGGASAGASCRVPGVGCRARVLYAGCWVPEAE